MVRRGIDGDGGGKTSVFILDDRSPSGSSRCCEDYLISLSFDRCC